MHDESLEYFGSTRLYLYVNKVELTNFVPSLNQPPIYEWYVVRCGSNNKYQKYTCLKEIRVCAENMITILNSVVKTMFGMEECYMAT